MYVKTGGWGDGATGTAMWHVPWVSTLLMMMNLLRLSGQFFSSLHSFFSSPSPFLFPPCSAYRYHWDRGDYIILISDRRSPVVDRQARRRKKSVRPGLEVDRRNRSRAAPIDPPPTPQPSRSAQNGPPDGGSLRKL